MSVQLLEQNIMPHPRPAIARGAWEHAGADVAEAIDPDDGTAYLRYTINSDNVWLRIGYSPNSRFFPLADGERGTYTLLARVRSSVTEAVSSRVNAGGLGSNNFQSQQDWDISPEWEWHRHTFTLVGRGDSLGWYPMVVMIAYASEVGDTLDLSHVLIVAGDYDGDYFDGATPEYAGTFYRWDGEPYASTSGAYTLATGLRLDTALDDVAAELTDAGVPAVVDPRNLNLPGVWVTPALVDFDRLDPTAYTLEVELIVVGRANGHRAALITLGDQLDRIRKLWPVAEAQSVSVTLPNHGGQLPALVVPVTVQVTEE